MSKKLVWKAFDTFEEMEADGKAVFLSLSPAQRIARFFAILAVRRALGIKTKPVDPDSFVLKKRNDTAS
jgi:hypothetical protein